MKSIELKKLFVLLIYLVNVLGQTAIAFPQSQSLEVPKGTTITVDGKMNEDEWKDALTQDLKGGGQIRFKHDGEFLQIGLEGGKPGLSHIYLAEGKDIFVLHSSASLGMAIYQKEDEVWKPIQKFEWKLMGQSSNGEAGLTYLKTSSWLANVASKPTLEREYNIGMKFRDGELFQVAAVYVGNPMSPQFFPTTLADDTLKMELLFGGNPANLRFKKEQWATLKLK